MATRRNENLVEFENSETEEMKQRKETNASRLFLLIGIVIIICIAVFVFVKNVLPDKLMEDGQRALNNGDAQKALSIFKKVESLRPYENKPIYFQALALSKLPPTFENQKALYEIAQLDDVEDASEIAEKILLDMRSQLDGQAGPNYIDNVLYENQLIRWNNSQPVKFYVQNSKRVPQEFIDVARNEFQHWQDASGNLINFREVSSSRDADIILDFVDDVSSKNNFEPLRAGITTPLMRGDVLNRMDIKIKASDNSGNYYPIEKIRGVIQHEIGHALGLFGHSSHPEDVMYIGYDYIGDDTFERPITERDINTLRLLYRMIPDAINVPLKESDYNNMFYHYIITDYPGENFDHEILRLMENLKHDKRNIVNWVDLAINYGLKKQYARSNYILNNVLPQTSNDLQNQFVVLYNLAANYYKLKEYDTSLKYLNLAQELYIDMDTEILESFLDLRMNRIGRGFEKLKELQKEHPENIEVALKLAGLYYKRNNKKDAEFVIEKLLKVNPDAIRDRRVLKYKVAKEKVDA